VSTLNTGVSIKKVLANFITTTVRPLGGLNGRKMPRGLY